MFASVLANMHCTQVGQHEIMNETCFVHHTALRDLTECSAYHECTKASNMSGITTCAYDINIKPINKQES